MRCRTDSIRRAAERASCRDRTSFPSGGGLRENVTARTVRFSASSSIADTNAPSSGAFSLPGGARQNLAHSHHRISAIQTITPATSAAMIQRSARRWRRFIY